MKKRHKEIKKICSLIKNCEQSISGYNHDMNESCKEKNICNNLVPKIKKENFKLFQFSSNDEDKNIEDTKKELTPQDCLKILNDLDENDHEILGFDY